MAQVAGSLMASDHHQGRTRMNCLGCCGCSHLPCQTDNAKLLASFRTKLFPCDRRVINLKPLHERNDQRLAVGKPFRMRGSQSLSLARHRDDANCLSTEFDW